MKAEQKIVERLDWAQIFGPLAQAEDSLARLDERLRSSPIRAGWIERTHFADACASLFIDGELAHLEDLVLHDARMDSRTPTAEIVRAARILAARRRMLAAAPGWALSPEGRAFFRGGAFLAGEGGGEAEDDEDAAEEASSLPEEADADDPLAAELAALDAALARSNQALDRQPAPAPEERDPLVYDLDWDEDERFAQWRGGISATEGLPPVLAAALAIALWDDLEPLQHTAWLGRLFAAALLRQRGKTRSHLLCLNLGARAAPRLRGKPGDPSAQILYWLAAISAAAEGGLKDHDRWSLALAARAGSLCR